MINVSDRFLKPEWDAPSSVQTLVTTRKGGVSAAPYDSLNLGDHVGDLPIHVLANRALLRAHLPTEPIWLKQLHGIRVSTPSVRLLEADAIVTNKPNEVLAIMTADCLPVLFSNHNGTIIGAAHAGWRGLCAGVLENTVREMRGLAHQDSEHDIIAWLGPAIGPRVFEVGQEVVEGFQNFGLAYPETAFIPIADKPGKYLADIYLLARSRLQAVGVQQISGGQYCTVTQGDQFFSYRRDGETGRFASLIWIANGQ
jgi:YfiH family protein